ncbi:MAG: DUF1028 domain-containing protein, partial [Candidatus Krumholzibacteria bacterium]|nr:DUF1028 domain-containing protein [Candidatus Krumholzibacteria bacterium]
MFGNFGIVRNLLSVSLVALCASAPFSSDAWAFKTPGERPVHTYSIVARDSVTGDMGVAVQSHWFSVGPVVPWARAGSGAVATQSLVLMSYGPLGLDLMDEGMSAAEALEKLIEEDAHSAVRQVAMVDGEGNAAAHTGDSCIAFASHRTGNGYSVQANMMLTDRVVPAMAKAYETAQGDLADRMLAALEAAQQAGGDIRGSQSAAILIVRGEASDEPWSDVVMDLRVEDNPRPLEELARLVKLQRAYEFENLGDEAMAEGNLKDAMDAYGEAARLAPDNLELAFWQGVSLVNVGRDDEGVRILKSVVERDANWKELLKRLPAAGLLTVSADRLEKIL